MPLPGQKLGTGITVDGSNTVFTVSEAGTYYISYSINLTASLLASSRLLINGMQDTPSTVSPMLSRDHFLASTIVNLQAGSTVSLQLFGLLGAATLLSNSQGAALTIIKIQ
ncbi:hypothetical protein L1F29_32805 [Paenibacillus spongiae]|uniref:BclA C-terminal domain-containing protein n=1 Tax=Paenibacillus spongiae TaxID=2909671 RepID=A0ABY5SJQ4_9BACL|nr:hypothetical protein L1F29_32805 [Paenibacillus spongiae]